MEYCSLHSKEFTFWCIFLWETNDYRCIADDEPEAEAVEDVKAEPQDEQQQLAKPEVKDDVDGLKKVQGGNENRPRREQIGTVVHVTDMSWYTTDIEVEAACGVYGTVKNVKFFEDRSNGRSMGACAVEFNTMEEAKACIAGLDGKSIGQDTVLVDWPGKRPPFKQRCDPGPFRSLSSLCPIKIFVCSDSCCTYPCKGPEPQCILLQKTTCFVFTHRKLLDITDT